jgi:hypothetical protein
MTSVNVTNGFMWPSRNRNEGASATPCRVVATALRIRVRIGLADPKSGSAARVDSLDDHAWPSLADSDGTARQGVGSRRAGLACAARPVARRHSRKSETTPDYLHLQCQIRRTLRIRLNPTLHRHTAPHVRRAAAVGVDFWTLRAALPSRPDYQTGWQDPEPEPTARPVLVPLRQEGP